jgi:hypothetical protein
MLHNLPKCLQSDHRWRLLARRVLEVLLKANAMLSDNGFHGQES